MVHYSDKIRQSVSNIFKQSKYDLLYGHKNPTLNGMLFPIGGLGSFPNRAPSNLGLIYDDDFTGADLWDDTISARMGVDTTNDEFLFDIRRDATNTKTVLDLQTILGSGNFLESKWLLRVHQHNFSTTGNAIGYFGIGDKPETTPRSGAQDAIYAQWGANGTDNQMGGAIADGIALPVNLNQTAYTYSSGVDRYLEVIRDDDDITWNYGTNSDFSSPAVSLADTGADLLQPLRYIFGCNYDSGTNGSLHRDGKFQRVQLWNGQIAP